MNRCCVVLGKVGDIVCLSAGAQADLQRHTLLAFDRAGEVQVTTDLKPDLQGEGVRGREGDNPKS